MKKAFFVAFSLNEFFCLWQTAFMMKPVIFKARLTIYSMASKCSLLSIFSFQLKGYIWLESAAIASWIIECYIQILYHNYFWNQSKIKKFQQIKRRLLKSLLKSERILATQLCGLCNKTDECVGLKLVFNIFNTIAGMDFYLKNYEFFPFCT